MSVDHGCGAHSETDVGREGADPIPAPILDDASVEAVVLPPRTRESEGPTA